MEVYLHNWQYSPKSWTTDSYGLVMGKISASQLLAPASLLVQCLKSSFFKNSSKVTVVSGIIWNWSERVPERETERKKRRATSSLSLPAQQ